jgi:hypothetical protein
MKAIDRTRASPAASQGAVNPDCTRRPEPSEMLPALQTAPF